MAEYVICPGKLTSPAPDPFGPFRDMPNIPCDTKCLVTRRAEVMEFRCARGHAFYATPKDIHVHP